MAAGGTIAVSTASVGGVQDLEQRCEKGISFLDAPIAKGLGSG